MTNTPAASSTVRIVNAQLFNLRDRLGALVLNKNRPS